MWIFGCFESVASMFNVCLKLLLFLDLTNAFFYERHPLEANCITGWCLVRKRNP
jgi:hypothetical protein